MDNASQAIREGIRRPDGSAASGGGRPDDAQTVAPPARPQDVWEWTADKYRVRSILLLLINAVLFAGLGLFAYWLRTGEYTPFASGHYWAMWWKAFDPTHDEQLTLLDYLISPIPASEVGFMMVIMGLLLGSLTAIPILVSMLYRFPFSLIFTFVIGFLAVLPWLAIVVTFGCYLARLKPLRFSFRYATALIALLPCVGYYIMATQGSSAPSDLPPLLVGKLYLPWALALVAACVEMAIVLAIAKAVNYRPGAIAPLLAVMFAVPVVLFEAKVGRGELYYRLLEANYGPSSTTHLVNNVDVAPLIMERAEQQWREMKDPSASKTAVIEQVRLHMLNETSEAVAAQREEIVRACEAFREQYPGSRHIPGVLYIEGRAMDMRFDRPYFVTHMRVRFYQNFPNRASRPVWETLYEAYPDAPGSLVAGYQLALLETRAGNVDRAIDLLDEVIRRAAEHRNDEAPARQRGTLNDLFGSRPVGDSLGINVDGVKRQSMQLRALLVNNRDPHQQDLALQRLFELDPYHWRYLDNLRRLLADIRSGRLTTRLGDNIELLIVLTSTRDSRSQRIDQLKALIERLERAENSDALPHALFELGRTYQIDNVSDVARRIYDRLIRAYPDSPWAAEAESQIANMGAATSGGVLR